MTGSHPLEEIADAGVEGVLQYIPQDMIQTAAKLIEQGQAPQIPVTRQMPVTLTPGEPRNRGSRKR